MCVVKPAIHEDMSRTWKPGVKLRSVGPQTDFRLLCLDADRLDFAELLAKVLPGVNPKDFSSLLDGAAVITPARHQNHDALSAVQKNDDFEAPSTSRLSSVSTARNLSHLINDDAMASPSSSEAHSFPNNRLGNHYTSRDGAIGQPAAALAPLEDTLSDYLTSSPQPLIAQLCCMSGEDAADRNFRLSANEYATIARQLGYSLLGSDSTALVGGQATAKLAKPVTSETDFWAEVLEMEDSTRKDEEETAKDNAWTFPPRDREMARRVIDKFFSGINRLRPIVNEEDFKRDYGRLSRGTIIDSEEFEPGFLACAHMILALGTAVMDLEAQQTKSALTEVPLTGPPIPFAPDPQHSGGRQEQDLATTIHGAAAMSDRPVPANEFVFPLGHSTLFDKNDIEENIDGIGKDDHTWPSASFFFQQGMRVLKPRTSTSLQDLQKMIMVFLWYSSRVPVRALWR